MEQKASLDRRDFLKSVGLVGGIAVASTALSPKAAYANGVGTSTYETIDDMIAIGPEFERYDMCNTAFSRAILGAAAGLLEPSDMDEPDLVDQWKGELNDAPFNMGVDPGYTQLDMALNSGMGALENLAGFNASRTQSADSGPSFFDEEGNLVVRGLYGQTSASFSAGGAGCFDVASERFEFETPEDAAYAIKKAAKKFGADIVGIAPYDERFVYKTETYVPKDEATGEILVEHANPMRPVEFDFSPKSVIVLAFEMDYEEYKAQPTYIGAASTTQGYSLMGEISLRVAKFLRDLGYNTRHCGNDTAVSVPLAIQAGLGEAGRMGLLITEEFGPRVRLAKVYTDLEAAYDKPKSFGVRQFCEVCQLCADNCPSEAISHCAKTSDPENQPSTISEQAGVDKWFLNPQKCLYNWFLPQGGAECGLCITVCPYNKPQTWNHELTKVVTRIPGLNSMAKYFDEFFGYGGIRDAQTIADFWKRTI